MKNHKYSLLQIKGFSENLWQEEVSEEWKQLKEVYDALMEIDRQWPDELHNFLLSDDARSAFNLEKDQFTHDQKKHLEQTFESSKETLIKRAGQERFNTLMSAFLEYKEA